MIARGRADVEHDDVWARLAAPVPPSAISWRQDGKPKAHPKDPRKFFARFVPYIEANTVRERLDDVVPGEWDLTLELLPTIRVGEEDAICFKARLQVLGVIREDAGLGKDYKQASTDAFKRAAVRFGIAHELYAYEQNWVQMDGDGKYAKPLEDPQQAYQRRYGMAGPVIPTPLQEPANLPLVDPLQPPASTLTNTGLISCPKCGGKMWDNRLTKRNPKAPDYKCQNRSCDGVIWPAKSEPSIAENQNAAPLPSRSVERSQTESPDSFPKALEQPDDELPF